MNCNCLRALGVIITIAIIGGIFLCIAATNYQVAQSECYTREESKNDDSKLQQDYSDMWNKID